MSSFSSSFHFYLFGGSGQGQAGASEMDRFHAILLAIVAYLLVMPNVNNVFEISFILYGLVVAVVLGLIYGLSSTAAHVLDSAYTDTVGVSILLGSCMLSISGPHILSMMGKSFIVAIEMVGFKYDVFLAGPERWNLEYVLYVIIVGATAVLFEVVVQAISTSPHGQAFMMPLTNLTCFLTLNQS